MFAVEDSSQCTRWKGVLFAALIRGSLLRCLPASMKAKKVKNCQAITSLMLKVIECLLKYFAFFAIYKGILERQWNGSSFIPNRFDFIEKWKLRISYFSKCDFAGWLEVSSRLGRRLDRRLPFNKCGFRVKLYLDSSCHGDLKPDF